MFLAFLFTTVYLFLRVKENWANDLIRTQGSISTIWYLRIRYFEFVNIVSLSICGFFVTRKDLKENTLNLN